MRGARRHASTRRSSWPRRWRCAASWSGARCRKPGPADRSRSATSRRRSSCWTSSDAGAIDAPGHRVDLRGRDFVLTSRPAGTRGRVSAAAFEPFRVSAVYSRRGAASRRGMRAVRGSQPGWRDSTPGRSLPDTHGRRWSAATSAAARCESGIGGPGTGSGRLGRRAEKAAGLLRGPEGSPAAARHGAAGRG